MKKTTLSHKVLFVDDEINVLNALRRGLRSSFKIDTALSAKEGLKLVKSDGPYAVVVSDMRMPVTDGADFLRQLKEVAPDTTRIMLTGNADLDTAKRATNEGEIFRFVNKPCPPEQLKEVVQDGIGHYEKTRTEKELLRDTVRGTIHALTEVLALVNPEAFGRVDRIKRLSIDLARMMGIKRLWMLEMVAELSQIGCVVLPQDALAKRDAGLALTEEEKQLFDMHPCLAFDLIKDIPRLESIARAVKYQFKGFDGSGMPNDDISGYDIPVGSRILRVVCDYYHYEAQKVLPEEVIKQMQENEQCYDPDILEALILLKQPVEEEHVQSDGIEVRELKDGMVLAENIYDSKGILLLRKGDQVSPSLRRRLQIFAQSGRLDATLQVQRDVIVPVEDLANTI